MLLGVIVAVMIGFTAGVTIETNVPGVSDFGDTYLSAARR